jgi:hypothetical protein
MSQIDDGAVPGPAPRLTQQEQLTVLVHIEKRAS